MVICDCSESFINMVFGNHRGFVKEDESVRCILTRLLKSVRENGLNYLENYLIVFIYTSRSDIAVFYREMCG